MDLTTLFTSGGLIASFGGVLYAIFNRRINKLEDGKVNKEAFEIIQTNNEKQLTQLNKTTSETHDAVILIKAALGITD